MQDSQVQDQSIQAPLISEEGFDALIQQLHDTTQEDIKEVEKILQSFKDEIFVPGAGINTTSLQIYQESLSEMLKTKIQTKDQLFKVAGLLANRLKERAKADSGEKEYDFSDIKKQINESKLTPIDFDTDYNDDDDE